LVKNKSGNKEKIISDNVLFSVGFKPKDKDYLGLKNGLISIEQNLCIYSIGDCMEDGKIYEAINSAAHIAWQL
jgi:pyruvate/2-oxoglutarate dehydrogenase complex dihydrolipoamide dehydrogenase (E3) component